MYSPEKYVFFSNSKIFDISNYMLLKLKQDESNYNYVYKKLFKIIMNNNLLKTKLKNTSQKLIVFCSEDNCGSGYDEIDVHNKFLDEWHGLNLVGQILMEIRSHIKY
jgi:predicted NAD-dependent protein-ADP-ribosyltransferase YbiA (DUF1768 family)